MNIHLLFPVILFCSLFVSVLHTSYAITEHREINLSELFGQIYDKKIHHQLNS